MNYTALARRACLLLVSLACAAPVVYRFEDFESYAEGPADAKLSSSKGGVFQQPGRWQGALSAPTPHIMEVVSTTGMGGEKTKAFRYRKIGEDKAGGVLQPLGPIPKPQGRYVYEATVKIGDATAEPFTYITYANVRIHADGSIACMKADQRTIETSLRRACPVGEWFRFRAEYDIPGDKATVFVNGEEVGVLPFPKGSLAAQSTWRWDFGGYGKKDGVVWIDDMKMIDPEGSWATGGDGTASAKPASAFRRVMGITPADALGFEKEGAWLSIPPEILDQMERSGNTEANLASTRAQSYRGVASVASVGLAELNGGLVLSGEHVRQGKTSGKWANHPRFPSIITTAVEPDWSRANALSLTIYSAVATGEVITLGVLNDNPETAWKDWTFHRFTIDWAGEKKLVIPFSAFIPNEKPTNRAAPGGGDSRASWSKVGALGLFAKAFGYQPSPQTILWLDDFQLVSGQVAAQLGTPPPAPSVPDVEGGILYRLAQYEKPVLANHAFPELGVPNPVVTAEKALSHGYYFAYERALTGWNPRFTPGYVSFDPSGKAYVCAGDRIQWVGKDGRWTHADLAPVIAAWARARGWPGVRNNWDGRFEPMLRFDRSGDAYALAQVTAIDLSEKEVSWTNRTQLLLHSRDSLRTWRAYVVPGGRLACFEKLDGHNTDAMNFPPALVIGDISYFAGTSPTCSLVVPVKKPDGTLELGGGYPYAENAIVGPPHSGDGSYLASVGDKIYLAWGWCPDMGHYPKILAELTNKGAVVNNRWAADCWMWYTLKDTELGKTLPPIPARHSSLTQTTISYSHTVTTKYSSNGVPTFVSVFDRKTRKFDPPVFVGMGGPFLDGHNWPALTVDSKGYLHVVINGHHDPVMYTRSLRPRDATEWTPATYVFPETARLSYSTLSCDKDDTLYTVHRSTSDKLYNNRLGFYRKKAGGEWEPERPLVWPFKYMYMVWYQRMSYDRTRDRLFLTYSSRGGQQQLAQDMYEHLVFTHPDQEAKLAANSGKPKAANHGRVTPWPNPVQKTGGDMYNPHAGDVAMLVSRDHGETWGLATTDDFK